MLVSPSRIVRECCTFDDSGTHCTIYLLSLGFNMSRMNPSKASPGKKAKGDAPSKNELKMMQQLEMLNSRMNSLQVSPQALARMQSESVTPARNSYGDDDTNAVAFRQKTIESEEMSFVIAGLQQKLSESHDELMRMSIKLDTELKDKRKMEQRNADLNSKLTDARQGLRDTQAALQSVQQATEQLTIKRDQRDVQMNRLLAENKAYDNRIYDLELKLRENESTIKSLMSSKDEVVEKLHIQLQQAQEASFKAQGEVVRMRGEKTLMETEVESSRRKVAVIEGRAKTIETNLEVDSIQRFEAYEERIRGLQDKLEEAKDKAYRITELEDEVRKKSDEIKKFDNILHEHEQERKEGQVRVGQLESQIRLHDEAIRVAQQNAMNKEQDFATAQAELTMTKRALLHSEEMMRAIAQQLQSAIAEKDGLQGMVDTLHRRIDQTADYPDLAKKLTRDLDRARQVNSDQTRHIDELERAVRTSTGEKERAVEEMKASAQKCGYLLSQLAEAKQAAIMANQRCADTFAELERVQHDSKGGKKSKGAELAPLVLSTSPSSNAVVSSKLSSPAASPRQLSSPRQPLGSGPRSAQSPNPNGRKIISPATGSQPSEAAAAEKASRKASRARDREAAARIEEQEREEAARLAEKASRKADRARMREEAARLEAGRLAEEQRLQREEAAKLAAKAKEAEKAHLKLQKQASKAMQMQNAVNSFSSLGDESSKKASVKMATLMSAKITAPNDEEIASVTEDEVKEAMRLKRDCKKKLLKWQKEFQNANGREPSQQDKENAPDNMFKTYHDVSMLDD